MTDRTKPPGIMLGQIFLERAQFGHREDALMLPANTPLGEPNLLFSFKGGVAPDDKTGFVRVTVQSKPDERPLYNIDVAMVALVQTQKGKENMPLRDYVRTAAPTMLYPFVREVVANLTWRGRFGPLWLVPMNVAAATAGATTEIAAPRDPVGQLPAIGAEPTPRRRPGARKAKKTKRGARSARRKT